MQPFSHSLSVATVNWFPLCNVRNKCECAHTMQVGMVLVVRPFVHYIYCDKHTRTCDEIKEAHLAHQLLFLFNSTTGQTE